MTRARRTFGSLALAATLAAGALFGQHFVRDVQFARAEQQVETSRENLAKAEDLSTVFRNVNKVMEPAVVNINVTKTIKGHRPSLPFDDEQLRKMFPDRDGDGEPDLPPGLGGGGSSPGGDDDTTQMGTGSGVIVETDGKVGYVVTNNHVAGGAERMTITLSDGRTIENGKLLGTDPKSDLAVVRIEADRLIPAKWGDSGELQKGDWIIAFGSPFGYVGSMTHGIVSALNRQTGVNGSAGILGRNGYENFIQVDAPINPGNSGGPLVNVRGEVVGINTAIASRSGGFQGIGFAIPSDQAKSIYAQLKDKGKVTRGWLGVSIKSVNEDGVADLAKRRGYDKADGVFVQDVMPGAPAVDHLQRGDIVTGIDGKPVKDAQDLRNRVASIPPGKDVKFSVWRDRKAQDVDVKLGEQPENLDLASGGGRPPRDGEPAAAGTGQLGLRLGDVTDDAAAKLNVGDDHPAKGALVVTVEPRSPAAREGVRPGDVVTKVGDTSVASAKEARDALAKEDLAKGVELYVWSGEGSRFVFVKSAVK